MEDKPANRAVSGWKTYEVVEKDTGVAPVSEAFKLHAPQASAALKKMQKLEELGFYEARLHWQFGDRKRKNRIVRPDDSEPPIWELKCTPHAWRLFFFTFEHSADDTDKRIIYLHADYKNTQKQDIAEVAVARERRGRVGTRDLATQQFEFPEGAVQQSGVQSRLGQRRAPSRRKKPTPPKTLSRLLAEHGRRRHGH